jgi:hypothetical protein
VYSDDRLSDVLFNLDLGRAKFGSEGPTVVKVGLCLRTVPPFDEPETSRMSESSWMRCRDNAEKGRSKRLKFVVRVNRGRRFSVDLENCGCFGESEVSDSYPFENFGRSHSFP